MAINEQKENKKCESKEQMTNMGNISLWSLLIGF